MFYFNQLILLFIMEKVQIKVSEVLALLKAGKTRKDIAEQYGLNGVQLKDLFRHPKLKNKKTVKEIGAAFILEDDTEEIPASASVADTVAATATTQAVEEVQETATEEAIEDTVEETEIQAVDQQEPVIPQERSLWEND